jgi:hypothetical protein
MMRKVLLFFLAALLLLMAGCGKYESRDRKLCFMYRGISIPMNAEAGPILYQLGMPRDFSFGKSGSTYCHGGFSVITYFMESAEYVAAVALSDATVATQEDIRIGDSRQEVEAAYGKENLRGDICTSTQDNTRLTILLTDDSVSEIRYELVFGAG